MWPPKMKWMKRRRRGQLLLHHPPHPHVQMTEMGGADESDEGGIVLALGTEEVGVGVEEVGAGVAVEVVEAAEVATAGAVIS